MRVASRHAASSSLPSMAMGPEAALIRKDAAGGSERRSDSDVWAAASLVQISARSATLRV